MSMLRSLTAAVLLASWPRLRVSADGSAGARSGGDHTQGDHEKVRARTDVGEVGAASASHTVTAAQPSPAKTAQS
jgi:hypothetical protein